MNQTSQTYLEALRCAPWRQCPADAGQIVDVRWLAVGAYGAICRTVDLSDLSTTYELLPWVETIYEPRYEPQNGIVDVYYDSAEKITELRAAQLWAEVNGR